MNPGLTSHAVQSIPPGPISDAAQSIEPCPAAQAAQSIHPGPLSHAGQSIFCTKCIMKSKLNKNSHPCTQCKTKLDYGWKASQKTIDLIKLLVLYQILSLDGMSVLLEM